MKMTWVVTSGGPLICATPAALSAWRGVAGSSTGDVQTDYERACAQLEYLSLIPCGTSEVLILGDEPMQSTFARHVDGFVIARWASCLSAERAEQAVSMLPSVLPEQEATRLMQLDGARLCMFDSALDSDQAMLEASCLDIVPGQYEITTERYSREEDFDFLIHRFRLLQSM